MRNAAEYHMSHAITDKSALYRMVNRALANVLPINDIFFKMISYMISIENVTFNHPNLEYEINDVII